jgi:hypothetical protein
MGPGTERDQIYLQVPNGRRLRVATLPEGRDPQAVPDGVDVWIERLPARVAAIPIALAAPSADITSTVPSPPGFPSRAPRLPAGADAPRLARRVQLPRLGPSPSSARTTIHAPAQR